MVLAGYYHETKQEKLTIEEFQKDMEGIYTTTANKSTIDESPRAYKNIDDIINFIGDTIEIEKNY